VKRSELLKHLEKHGCVLLRHGGKHDVSHNPVTGVSEPVPRHADINEQLAKRIINSLTQPG
jgi:predicted RNA binding protein YcfA (HicA-like mRNA interferase family)